MKTTLLKACPLALVTMLVWPSAATASDPVFVEEDTMGVYKALHGMAYRRRFEINIAARRTRDVSYSEDEHAFHGRALACVADPRGNDLLETNLVDDLMTRFGPVCDAQGATAILIPYEQDSYHSAVGTDISWVEWANTDRQPKGQWGGELYCGVGNVPLFRARAMPALRGVGCIGRTAVELLVPKPGSTVIQTEWQQAVALGAEGREADARQVAAERQETARTKERLEAAHAAMATVERGTRICSDTVLRGNRVLYGYVEEAAGSRVKVLIQGNSGGFYTPGYDPAPQDIHWYSRSDWRVCE